MSRRLLPALLLASALVLAGCGDDEDADSAALDSGSGANETPSAAASVGPPCKPTVHETGAGQKPHIEVPANSGPPAKLEVTDLKPGTGAAATAGSTVTAHYLGVGCLSGKEFDSSWDRGQPIDFSLQQVIPGWTQGLDGMKVGGRRLLVIPPDLAYGEMGSAPVIAPNESLVFVVDLMGVK